MEKVIKATTTIYNSNVFSKIDPAFKDLKITDQVKNPEDVEFYELLDNSNFLQAFLGISSKPSTLALSEKSVVDFCRYHRLFLEENNKITFFYLGNKNIAGVEKGNNGLTINKYHLHSDTVLSASRTIFFIIPA